MTKERRLGRGLEALLGQIPNRAPAPATTANPQGVFQGMSNGAAEAVAPAAPAEAATSPPAGHAPTRPAAPDFMLGARNAPVAGVPLDAPPPAVESPLGLKQIAIDAIARNPAQPRQEFDADELESLSESIASHGLLQPLVVRRVQDRYELIAGERRLRAARQAGLDQVPVNVIEVDERASAELAIVENLHRKDLNALEKAASFQQYLDRYRCTQEELASRLKLDRSTIANLIRLLELPESVQQALRAGRVTPGHARALLPLGDEREQVAFCQRIEREGLNVRDTEALVQSAIADADTDADAEPLAVVGRDGGHRRPARATSEHLAALEQEFRAALGMKVKITHNARGRGKLVVNFADHDEFDRLHEIICGDSGELRSRAG